MGLKFNALVPPFDMTGSAGPEGPEGALAIGSYSAEVEKAYNTEYEVSATKAAMVVLTLIGLYPSFGLLYIDGVVVTEISGYKETEFQNFSFLIEKGKKWKFEAVQAGSRMFESHALITSGKEGPEGKEKEYFGEGAIEVLTNKIKVIAKGITDAMLEKLYALLAGRTGGQTLTGNSEAAPSSSTGLLLHSHGPLIERAGKIKGAGTEAERKEVTGLSKTSDLVVGETVQTPAGGIPVGTTIAKILTETTIELSVQATETVERTLRFTNAPNAGWLEILAEGTVKIRKGQILGILSVAQISGLEQLTASGSIESTAGSVGGAAGLSSGAYVLFGEVSPAAIETGNKNNLEANAVFVRLISTVATYLTGLTAIGGKSELKVLTNVGEKNITLQYETKAVTCQTKTASKVVTIASTKGIFVGGGITGAGIPANTTVLTVPSETEITISKNATTEENVARDFPSPSTASRRFLFSTKADIVLEPGHSIALIYDATTLRWRDVIIEPPWTTEAAVEHTAETYELTPSTTRNSTVVIRAVSKTLTTAEYNIKVGGVIVDAILAPSITGSVSLSTTVPVPAGAVLKVEKVAGELEKSFTQVTLT